MSSKCTQCREGILHEERLPCRYAAGGLPHVILDGATLGRCSTCGAETLTIPRIAQLHRVLALTLATKPTRLMPNEARFLRKYLGYSSSDLAAIIGVAPETVSRWESTKSPQPIGVPTERLLRLLALRERPVEEYPSGRLAEITEGNPEATLRFAADGAGWHLAA